MESKEVFCGDTSQGADDFVLTHRPFRASDRFATRSQVRGRYNSITLF